LEDQGRDGQSKSRGTLDLCSELQTGERRRRTIWAVASLAGWNENTHIHKLPSNQTTISTLLPLIYTPLRPFNVGGCPINQQKIWRVIVVPDGDWKGPAVSYCGHFKNWTTRRQNLNTSAWKSAKTLTLSHSFFLDLLVNQLDSSLIIIVALCSPIFAIERVEAL